MKENLDLSAVKKYIPVIENSENILREMCENKVRKLYGTIPTLIQKQIDMEISFLKKYNDINFMIIFGRLAANKDIKHYMLSPQGGLKAYLISYLLGIANANPLLPHYRCPECAYSDFDTSKYTVNIGADLPDKVCPVCGKKLVKDGLNLHNKFENIYKGPCPRCFVLNTPEIIRNKIIDIIKDMHEINTVTDIPSNWHLSSNIPSVTKIIIPKYMSKSDFCSIGGANRNIYNEHLFYDFQIYQNNKIINMLNSIITLADMTNTDPNKIELNEKEVITFFRSYIFNNSCDNEIAEILSDKETDIIKACSPETISDIIKCLALSYDMLWEHSFKNLIENGTITIKDVISTGEDLYETFISYGIDKKINYTLLYDICKGHIGHNLDDWQKKIMHDHNIPQWSIDFCDNVSELLPRAHIAEIFILKWKLIYYKLHYPDKFSAFMEFKNNTENSNQTIPFGIKTISRYMFINKPKLINTAIPGSVTELADYSFSDCRNIKNILIPDSVVHIGKGAFTGCSNLTVVTIPKSVKVMDKNAFDSCSALTHAVIQDSINKIEDNLFANCISLASVSLPSSVVEIGMSAFFNCCSLTYISIPDSVTKIGKSAFYNCSNLTAVSISDSLIEIEILAFGNCCNLAAISLPDSLIKIGTWAFFCCVNLTSVSIPDSVVEIGVWAFYGCTNLTAITIPESVTVIGSNAFENCPELTIYTPSGSYAEKYAKDNNIHFKLI